MEMAGKHLSKKDAGAQAGGRSRRCRRGREWSGRGCPGSQRVYGRARTEKIVTAEDYITGILV